MTAQGGPATAGPDAGDPVEISRSRYDAVIFDLDGVVTATAAVHAQAWRHMFDAFLAARPRLAGENRAPFADTDYRRYIDGRSRADGVAGFLAARRIYLPYGNPDDPPGRPTVYGLGNRKDRYFRQELRARGATAYPSTVSLVHELRRSGFGTAVVSASRHCAELVAAAGLADVFDVRVDGVDAGRLGLTGKPDPALHQEAARRLRVAPARTVVVEGSEPGVTAGRRGGFGLVIGVDRTGGFTSLRSHGADEVVADLAAVSVGAGTPPVRPDTSGAPARRLSTLPAGVAARRLAAERIAGRPPALFCDFDGTLAPIVADPDGAYLPPGTRDLLARIASHHPVAVVSGRDLPDVRARIGLSELWYAGCHGFELAGPGGVHHVVAQAWSAQPALAVAAGELRRQLADVPGSYVEAKRFTVAVHYRRVADADVAGLLHAVRQVALHQPELAVSSGRKVVELRPAVAWDKGVALRWLVRRLGLADPDGRVRADVAAVYVGDDLTDEDALREVRDHGLGIVVRNPEHGDRTSAAHVAVADPDELRSLLASLLTADQP